MIIRKESVTEGNAKMENTRDGLGRRERGGGRGGTRVAVSGMYIENGDVRQRGKAREGERPGLWD